MIETIAVVGAPIVFAAGYLYGRWRHSGISNRELVMENTGLEIIVTATGDVTSEETREKITDRANEIVNEEYDLPEIEEFTYETDDGE